MRAVQLDAETNRGQAPWPQRHQRRTARVPLRDRCGRGRVELLHQARVRRSHPSRPRRADKIRTVEAERGRADGNRVFPADHPRRAFAATSWLLAARRSRRGSDSSAAAGAPVRVYALKMGVPPLAPAAPAEKSGPSPVLALKPFSAQSGDRLEGAEGGILESPCASARKSLSRRSATSSSSGARYRAALSGRRYAAEPGASPQVCLKPPVSASVIGVWTGCLSKCAIARPKSSMSSAARSRVRPCRTKIRWTATSARLAGRV
jgi:hypothetical protein